MSIYAIGDIQGCFSALKSLIQQFQFDPTKDRLWFVGDLVNRGPDSLAVLRYVKALGRSAVVVLGNHDLHVLAVAEGCTPLRRKDTVQDILTAPDREELLSWLRQQPLLHRDKRYVMVHAGLLPQWTVETAVALAHEVEHALRSNEYRSLLRDLYSANATRWKDDLTGMDRLVTLTKAFTRLRVCTKDGDMNFDFKGPPDDVPNGFLPWFEIPTRKNTETTIVCGHWSALGIRIEKNLLAIDGGCVWGRQLVAVRLEDRQVFHATCDRTAF